MQVVRARLAVPRKPVFPPDILLGLRDVAHSKFVAANDLRGPASHDLPATEKGSASGSMHEKRTGAWLGDLQGVQEGQG
jgi:hypothetical protein